MQSRPIISAALALSLLSGCATDATLSSLHNAESGCAAGNAAFCNDVEPLKSKASGERIKSAIVGAILLPVAILFVLAAAAPPPQPDYVVFVPCRRRWAC